MYKIDTLLAFKNFRKCSAVRKRTQILSLLFYFSILFASVAAILERLRNDNRMATEWQHNTGDLPECKEIKL